MNARFLYIFGFELNTFKWKIRNKDLIDIKTGFGRRYDCSSLKLFKHPKNKPNSGQVNWIFPKMKRFIDIYEMVVYMYLSL